MAKDLKVPRSSLAITYVESLRMLPKVNGYQSDAKLRVASLRLLELQANHFISAVSKYSNSRQQNQSLKKRSQNQNPSNL